MKEKWESFSEEELKNIILTSKTFKEAASKLGYNGGFYESKDTIQQRDKIKESYCKENNIPLIIIPYTDYFKIDT